MKEPLLNVALLGMNDKNSSTFTYFIKKHASHYLQMAVAEKADVYIVDFDSEAGIRQWHQHCKNDSKAAIIISAVNPEKPDSIWVKKPVSAQNLEVAISQLLKRIKNPVTVKSGPGQPVAVQTAAPIKGASKESHLHVVASHPAPQAEPAKKPGYQKSFADDSSPNLTLSSEEILECCGSQMDGDCQGADFRARVSYDEGRTLLAPLKKAIQLAREKNCAVEIQNLHIQLVVMPGGERIMIDLGNHLIRHICAMPLQAMPAVRTMLFSVVELEKRFPAHHPHMHKAEAVVWQIALWTSRGRLPKSIDPLQSIKLEFWPNFTRLQVTPHAIHIASLWVKHSMSPVDMANVLHVPQRYVFALAAAAQAVDSFVVTNVASNKSVETGWKKSHEFFSTILRSLKIA